MIQAGAGAELGRYAAMRTAVEHLLIRHPAQPMRVEIPASVKGIF